MERQTVAELRIRRQAKNSHAEPRSSGGGEFEFQLLSNT